MRRAARRLACVGWALATLPTPASALDEAYRLKPVSFAELPGFASDDHADALRAFLASCGSSHRGGAKPPQLNIAALRRACAAAVGAATPRVFFERNFQPYRIETADAADAFFTGYYQPEIPGSLTPSRDFATPAFGLPPATTAPSFDRAAIEDGALEGRPGVKKLVFLRDKADLFLAQVQGSARVRLRDGRILHLTFAGRNGQPYTALARVLVQRGVVASPADMTMRRLIDWLRQNGLAKGEPGDDLLRLNKSYVFFEARIDKGAAEAPRGGSGAPLRALRSIAVDAHVWSYGLPFYIAARLPWSAADPTPFQRLVIAQDTGSAIVGPARADIFFGLGDAAGARAGEIRHHGAFYLLLPRD